MNKTQSFIKKYLNSYLLQCQRYSLNESEDITPVPPTSKELEMILSYLKANHADFAIIGSIAIVKHLELTADDYYQRVFRPTKYLEILISTPIPTPPKGWKLDEEMEAWFTSKNHYVKFLSTNGFFPNQEMKIGKDPESFETGCPIADLLTLSQVNLNSGWVKDLLEIVTLWRKVGIPENLEQKLWNAKQLKQLELIKLGPMKRSQNENKQ